MSYERKNIARMSGYVSGEQPRDDKTIKLNTNENPYPPAAAIAGIFKDFDPAVLRRYPPPTANGFRDMAASIHGVERDNIIATRGGDELLRLLLTTFVEPGECIFTTNPTYSLYPVLAEIQNCEIHYQDLLPDWCIPDDFCSRANSLNAKLTLLVNPHAPSGHLVSRETIDEYAAALNGLFLVDEAYVDFIDPEENYACLDLIHKHENLIFLRSLSKGYSLAGLRFGYGIASAGLINPMLTKTRDSYNLDYISQKIAEIALADQRHAAQTWSAVRQERTRVQHALWELGFDVPSSQSNFLLATVSNSASIDAEALYEELKTRGILVRYFRESRLQNSIRITIGTQKENDALITELRNLIGAN